MTMKLRLMNSGYGSETFLPWRRWMFSPSATSTISVVKYSGASQLVSLSPFQHFSFSDFQRLFLLLFSVSAFVFNISAFCFLNFCF